MEEAVAYYSEGLHSFKDEENGFSFVCENETVTVLYSDISRLKLSGDMGAKNGAYIKLIIDAKGKLVEVMSQHSQFFELLFDILSMKLDVDVEAMFDMASANTKKESVIYEKEIEQ